MYLVACGIQQEGKTLFALGGVMMKKEGAKSTVLATEKLLIENKTIFIDLKENGAGKFYQIAELSNDRRSTIVIPDSGINEFIDSIAKISAADSKESE